MGDTKLLFDKYIDAQSFCTDSFDIVQQLCASANNLPEAGEEFDFYQSFSDVADTLQTFSSKLLTSVNRLLKEYTSSPPIGSHGRDRTDEHIEHLIEVNDELLERISNGIDEATGVKKHATATTVVKTSWRSPAVRYSAEAGMMTASHDSGKQETHNPKKGPGQSIQKPQLGFDDPIDNTDFPFIPKLTYKPHAINPLPFKLTFRNRKITTETLIRQPEILEHPYIRELEAFEPNEEQMQRLPPQSPIEWGACPFFLVSSKQQLNAMLDHLKQCSDIAIDLEHHNMRSYMGFTCLVQISTRHADYVIDGFVLREDIRLLNEVTTNPKILKVFHGADSDIVWLQKDFGVYVVNMFDTHQAARLLGFPYLSLSYLLKRYCDVDAAKWYQRADWRVRPLPDELVDYARTDTHYLLYIYDLLRNELIDKGATTSSISEPSSITNLLHAVYERSKTVCMKKYEKPIFDKTDYLKLIQDSCRVFNNRQLHALKLLYGWRDRVARDEDESPDYVLPNHMLMKIAEYLPKEKQGIFGCCNPIPIHVKQNLIEIHQYIISAREVELAKPFDEIVNETEYFEPPPFDPESLLNCVHDHIHCSDNIGQEFENPKLLWTALVALLESRNRPIVELEAIGPQPMLRGLSLDKLESQPTKRVVKTVLKSLSNPLIPYVPKEMLTDVDKLFLKKQENVRGLTWHLATRDLQRAVDDGTHSRCYGRRPTATVVLPTPAEINNADDIVPLRKRKEPSASTVRQPPPVPLLPSYLQQLAAQQKVDSNAG